MGLAVRLELSMPHPLTHLLPRARDPELGSAVGDAIDTGIKTEAGVEAASAGIGAAIGMSVPIPGLDVAIAAIAAAIAAISAFLSGLTSCTFHPDALTAASWLLLFRFCPGLIYSGIDTVTTEKGAHQAARLVRYFRLVAGMVKKGHLGNNGLLYNPTNSGYKKLPTDHLQTNPYIESGTDPEDHLTNEKIDQGILNLVLKYNHRVTAPEIPSLIHTPDQAKKALKLLRDPKFAKSGIVNWSELSEANGVKKGLRTVVARVRWLAGERGPDAHLAHLLGGDVTAHPGPAQHGGHAAHHPHAAPGHHDPKVGATPSEATPINVVVHQTAPPSRIVWFGLGAVTLLGGLVGLATYKVSQVEKKLNARKEK